MKNKISKADAVKRLKEKKTKRNVLPRQREKQENTLAKNRNIGIKKNIIKRE